MMIIRMLPPGALAALITSDTRHGKDARLDTDDITDVLGQKKPNIHQSNGKEARAGHG